MWAIFLTSHSVHGRLLAHRLSMIQHSQHATELMQFAFKLLSAFQLFGLLLGQLSQFLVVLTLLFQRFLGFFQLLLIEREQAYGKAV